MDIVHELVGESYQLACGVCLVRWCKTCGRFEVATTRSHSSCGHMMGMSVPQEEVLDHVPGCANRSPSGQLVMYDGGVYSWEDHEHVFSPDGGMLRCLICQNGTEQFPWMAHPSNCRCRQCGQGSGVMLG